jgi:hypothetical protein
MESINTIQVKTNQCPYCDQPVLAGSYVCSHCQNNLQIRKSVPIKLQSNGLLLAIYIALLGGAFFASGFMVAKKDIIHFRPSYRHITARIVSAQIAAIDTLIEEANTGELSTAKTAADSKAANECLTWDEIETDQLEKKVCVFGKIFETRLNGQGIYTIRFSESILNSLILVDDESDYDFSTGDCIRARGNIIDWNTQRAVEISGDISEVDASHCE